MLNIMSYLGNSLLTVSVAMHMKWSHGFILGTEVVKRPTLDAHNYLGSSVSVAT